jgi:hypothetical protein
MFALMGFLLPLLDAASCTVASGSSRHVVASVGCWSISGAFFADLKPSTQTDGAAIKLTGDSGNGDIRDCTFSALPNQRDEYGEHSVLRGRLLSSVEVDSSDPLLWQ